MDTVTKKELIQKIALKLNLHPKEVGDVVQNFLDSVTDTLAKGNRLEFRDFGVFEVVERKKKIGRNPKKASVPIVIPARKAVKFSPGKLMKSRVESLQGTPTSQEPPQAPPQTGFKPTSGM